MKKLLTLAVALCVTAMSQAYTISWKDADFTDTMPNLGTTSFVFATTKSATTATTSAALAAALAIKDGNAGSLDWATVDGLTVTTPQAILAGTLSGTITTATKPLLPSAANEANSTPYYNYFAFILSADGKQALLVDLGDSEKVNSGWMTTGSLTSGQATYSADATVHNVPEPTALALLALGVAGLALRRKVK